MHMGEFFLVAIAIVASSMMVDALNEIEILGPLEEVYPGVNYSWSPQEFAGFFYDIDEDLGAERITFNVSDNNIIMENTGVIYQTTSQEKNFELKEWGSYKLIGFLGEPYFVSYYGPNPTLNMIALGETGKPCLFKESDNTNLMNEEQLSEVLMDSNEYRLVSPTSPLRLEDGYQLTIASIDITGKKILIKLLKDGEVIDTKVRQPSIKNAKIDDKTYYYRTDVGSVKDIITIAVHFRNTFPGTDGYMAIVDGVFQISDIPTYVKRGTRYGNMTIQSIETNPEKITLINKEKDISLKDNEDIPLTRNIKIKTSNQVDLSSTPLKFQIYRVIKKPGTYQIRGTVADLGDDEVIWDRSNFAGFYCDMDNDLGKERITLRLSDRTPDAAILSEDKDNDGNRGVVYITQTESKPFEFESWGQYDVIGFLGEKCFAAYDKKMNEESKYLSNKEPFLWKSSKDKDIMDDEQLSRVLNDTDEYITVPLGKSLKLDEGYELTIRSIDFEGNKIYLELSKDGNIIDNKVISPSNQETILNDMTYFYKKDIGESKNVAVIGIHFDNAFRSLDDSIAAIDGIFQIEDTPNSIEFNKDYGLMSIRSVDQNSGKITMDNKDYEIILSKGKDILLMENMRIRTADQDYISELNPLRFYIYREAIIPTLSGETIKAFT